MADNNPLQLPLFKLGRLIVQIKPQLIDAMGVEAMKFIDDNFRKEGFQGATFTKWPGRKGKQKGASRKILVQSGQLRRSFKQTNGSDSVTISTDIPYARIHNEGGQINHPSRTVILSHREKKGGRVFSKAKQATTQVKATIGAHTTTMPQRQFIGNSPVLTQSIEKVLIRIILNAVNTL